MLKKLIHTILAVILGCFLGGILYKIAQDNNKNIALKSPQFAQKIPNKEKIQEEKKENLKDYFLKKWFYGINNIVQKINLYLPSLNSNIKPYSSS
ncbi:hypothetical protein [Candidatus Phytoplasma sacchari]|nr:hypothetical protein [Candidatus Phytoplasma sacchari]KAB8121782.1 hypothetical protein F2B49_02135 [Candidatus Phytoplasma sacchari]